MARLNKNEVESRDKSAPCYDYYKPIPGQEYKGQKVKRIHYCERCELESSLLPSYFWNGRGCQNCSSRQGQGQELDTNEVLKRDMSAKCAESYPPIPNQTYINSHKKRLHKCTDCGHQGQLIAKLFWTGTGCPICGAIKGSKNKIENAKKTVKQKDLVAHAYNSYPPISEYKGVSAYRLHRCNVCGHEGKMKPDNFWHNGRGCPECGIKLGSSNKRANMKKIAPDRDKKSKHYLSYSPITEYEGAFDHRIHHCNVCGHEGLMTPRNFWLGQGCPVCAPSGLDKTAPAILYYLRVTKESDCHLYKIGITNRTVKDRYNNTDLALIKVVKEWAFDTGEQAHQEEQRILKSHASDLYQDENVLSSGNTELFTRDILDLDDL